jgi:elongation factor P--(R)-beta-lysine ligase
MPLEESRRLSQIKNKLEYRARLTAGIRAFFLEEGFLEIDTPVRVPAIAPEQFIWPYTSENWFLSTSPELQMKRLLAAGYEKIYQIAHCFRRDERGRHHNPEFSMLEWYRAGADYQQIIADTENLLVYLAAIKAEPGTGHRGTNSHEGRKADQEPSLTYQGQTIDLSRPWPRITVREAYRQWAGWDPFVNFDGQRFDDDLVDKVIPRFPANRPQVIMDYPLQCAALARLKPGQTDVAERAEVFMGGLEIANAYSELNNPVEQRQRFKDEMALMQQAGKPCIWPEKFIAAIETMPACGGIAVGVDRVAMLLSDAASIDEVIAFPSDLL